MIFFFTKAHIVELFYPFFILTSPKFRPTVPEALKEITHTRENIYRLCRPNIFVRKRNCSSVAKRKTRRIRREDSPSVNNKTTALRNSPPIPISSCLFDAVLFTRRNYFSHGQVNRRCSRVKKIPPPSSGIKSGIE